VHAWCRTRKHIGLARGVAKPICLGERRLLGVRNTEGLCRERSLLQAVTEEYLSALLAFPPTSFHKYPCFYEPACFQERATFFECASLVELTDLGSNRHVMLLWWCMPNRELEVCCQILFILLRNIDSLYSKYTIQHYNAV